MSEAEDDEAAKAKTTTTTTSTSTTPITPKDDEGLLLEYDVIVCGTGLVQAILASALARAGKNVLHCDGDDMYGELDAVWPLSKLQQEEEDEAEFQGSSTPTTGATTTTTPEFPMIHKSDSTIPLSPKGGTTSLQFHSFQRQTRLGITMGTPVQTVYGSGVIQSLPTTNTSSAEENNEESLSLSSSSRCNSVAVVLDKWNQNHLAAKDGTTTATPVVSYFGIDPEEMLAIDVTDPLALEDFLHQRHNIQSIASLQVQALFQDDHRMMRSFALDASPVFVLAAGRAVDGMLASNVADYLEFKAVEALLWLDTNNGNTTSATTKQGSPSPPTLSRVPCSKNDVFTTKLLSPMDKRRLMKFLQLAMDYATQMSVAEEILKELRNQQVVAGEMAAADGHGDDNDDQVQSLNERHLNQGRSLARPQNKAVAKEDLITLQQCMQQSDMTLDDYLHQQHKLSPKLREIIRYALAMEISSSSTSLSQGMSQLRHHLQALGRYGTTAFLVPMYGSGELSQAFCRSAAVFGATYLLRRAPIAIQSKKDDDDDKIRVEGVLVAADTMDDGMASESSALKDKIVRCSQVVVPRNALPSKKAPTRRILRRISIMNGTLVDGEQRHVIFLPPHSIGNHPYAIHGITMDESVQVAPSGFVILHLTTIITVASNDESSSSTKTILDQAAETIFRAKAVVEVYSATYSFALAEEEEEDSTYPEGVYICSPCGQVLTADVAFEQAEKIFQKICPGQEFLGLSDELDAAIKERAAERGYQDEERLMLESALGMINDEETSDQGAAIPETVNESKNNEELGHQ